MVSGLAPAPFVRGRRVSSGAGVGADDAVFGEASDLGVAHREHLAQDRSVVLAEHRGWPSRVKRRGGQARDRSGIEMSADDGAVDRNKETARADLTVGEH